jgi:von Willebrand factor type A domain-containing protein
MGLKLSTPASVVWALTFAALGACSSSNDSDGAGGTARGNGGPIFDTDFAAELPGPTGDGDGFNSDLACAGEIAGAESAPAVLQLVVDTSGSMDQNAPGTSGSKWTVTRRALLGAVEQMPGETAVGVVFYPDVASGSASCFDDQIDVGIGRLDAANSAQRKRIQAAFQSQNPEGGTPTHDAYRYAFENLAASSTVGARFVVLITDGTPTYALGCKGTGLIRDPVDSAPLVAEAAKAAARGVSTFVIGSPGSEDARENLSRMAEAGGTAPPGCSHSGPNYCHFDMTQKQDFASALAEALGTISGLALSCKYDIPKPPVGATLDPGQVNVLFSPSGGQRELIAQSAAGACSDGWQYSQDGTQVLLCGPTCDRVRASTGSLELQFGCATQVR